MKLMSDSERAATEERKRAEAQVSARLKLQVGDVGSEGRATVSFGNHNATRPWGIVYRVQHIVRGSTRAGIGC